MKHSKDNLKPISEFISESKMKRKRDNLKPISEILKGKLFQGEAETITETETIQHGNKPEKCFCPHCLTYQMPDYFSKKDLDFTVNYRATCSICSSEFLFQKRII